MTRIYVVTSPSEKFGAQHVAEMLVSAGAELVETEGDAQLVVEVRGPGAPAVGRGGISVGTATHSAIGDNPRVTNIEGDIQAGSYVNGDQVIGGDYTVNAQGMVQNNRLTGEGMEVLETLLEQLRAELAKVPSEHAPEAQYVEQKADQVVAEATSANPKWWQIQIEGEALRKAAENLRDVTPIVLTIAGQIVAFIARASAG